MSNPTIGGLHVTDSGSSSDVSLTDNINPAYRVHEGSNDYENISTLDGAERITWGNFGATTPAHTFYLPDNVGGSFGGNALDIIDSASTTAYFVIDTRNGAELISFGRNGIALASVKAYLPGNRASDFLVSAASITYFECDTTTAAEKINYGSASASTPSHAVFLRDNAATALQMLEGATAYFTIATTNAAESISLGNTLTTLTISAKDNSATALRVLEAANSYINVSTANAAERITFGNTGATTPAYTFQVPDNVAIAFRIAEAATSYLTVISTNGSERVLINAAAFIGLAARGTPSGGANEGCLYGGTSGANTELSYREPNSGQDINLTAIGELWAQNALRVEERGTDPATVANAGKLYAKDVSTITELFWVNSAGTVVQITSGSSLARDISIPDNTAVAFRIKEGANNYFLLDTSNASEQITLGNATTRQRLQISCGVVSVGAANTQASAFEVIDAGSANYFSIDTSTTAANRKINVGRDNGGTISWVQFIRNATNAFSIKIGAGDELLNMNGTAASEAITLGNTTANCPQLIFDIRDDKASALLVQQGANSYLDCTTSNGVERINIGGGIAAIGITLAGAALVQSMTAIGSGFALQSDESPAALANGNNNNLAIGAGTVWVRLTAAAGAVLTGLAGGSKGRIVILINVDSADDISVTANDAASTAANRFGMPANITLTALGGSQAFIYDNTSSLWRKF